MSRLLWDQHFPVLRLEGSGSRTFLHGQTSSDIVQAEACIPFPTCWLDANGRVQALLEIRLDATGADVLVLAGAVDDVSQGFDRVIFPADHLRLKGTRQQRRQELLIKGQPLDPGNVLWATDDQNTNNQFSELGVVVNKDQLDHWRLEQGWPLGPAELDGTTNPFELGLSPWVNLNKGCYLGQETVAKLSSRGAVKQQLRSWRTTLNDSPDKPPEHGTVLVCKGERAGVITSALQIENANGDPQGWVGLALIRRKALSEAELKIEDEQTSIQMFKPLAFSEPPSRASVMR